MKKTIHQIIALLIIELMILLPIYTAEALTISNVQHQATERTARITWQTDLPSTSKTDYGSTTNLESSKQSNILKQNHEINLSNLDDATTYYYSVSSSTSSETITDDNSGNYFTFTTPQDTTPPYIYIDVPEYHNSYELIIEGTTEPSSLVRLYVDNFNIPRRSFDPYETTDGTIRFALSLDDFTKIRIYAKDPAGNENIRDFNITVDNDSPELNVSNIPYRTYETNLSLKGSVDENVMLYVYVTKTSSDSTPPPKIENLRTLNIGSNLVELEWNQIDINDFDQYIIYRTDIGPIATTDSITYNTFSDVRVNTSTTYNYQLTAMDLAGNIGEASDSLEVTTLEGGSNAILPPEPIDITLQPEGDNLVFSQNINGAFEIPIELSEGDGLYEIRVEAVDKANNTASVTEQVTLDSEPPTLELIRPRSGTSIYQTTANNIDMYGLTEPYSEVHLYIQRTPLGFLNDSFDVAGLARQIEDIPESQLRSSCSQEIAGDTICYTGSDFSTIADDQGNFDFESIDLTSIYSRSVSVNMIPPGDSEFRRYFERYHNLNEDRPQRTNILLIATDPSGQRSAITAYYSIATCRSGNFTWNVNLLNQYQSPTFLSTERIAEGTESIYFYINLTYFGVGERASVESIDLKKACDTILKDDPKYNISCRILPSSCTPRSSDDRLLHYVACPLQRYDDFNRFMEDDWKDFLKSINSEMIFPFKIRIKYTYEEDGVTKSEIQTQCFDVAYVVDNSKINFKEVLPDWLLYDAVEWLNKTITTLNKIQKQIKTVLEYVAYACIATYVAKFVLTVRRRFTCYWEGYQETTLDTFKNKKDEDKKEGEEPCPLKESERKRLSNFELKRDCETCADAWDFEAKLYTVYRTLCDRVFCHSAPARWTESKDDVYIEEKLVNETKVCGDDLSSVRGQVLRETKCSGYNQEYLNMDLVRKHAKDGKCYETFMKPSADENKKNVVFVKNSYQPHASSNIYKFSLVSKEGPTIGLAGEIWALKEGSQFMTARTATCAELCTGSKAYACGPSQSCAYISLTEEDLRNQAHEDRRDHWVNELKIPTGLLEYEPDKEYNPTKAGLGYDCMLGLRTPAVNEKDNIKTDDGSKSFECCCIDPAEKVDYDEFYDVDDVSTTSEEGEEAIPAFTPKEETYTVTAIDTDGETKKDLEMPKFSYRYNKIKYEALDKPGNDIIHNKYNPHRYVPGRDWPGCFGQKSVWLAGENRIMHDPFKNHISAFQCLCISGIYNRLQLIKNILASLQGCLIEVRTTGTADAGVCKEIFSQYVCSMFWHILVYFKDGCLPWGGKGIDLGTQENTLLAAFGGGTNAVVGGIGEAQTEIAEEYGNVVATNLLGASEEMVARKICMMAFGYDWELDINDVLDVAYSTPMATLVQAVAPSREYLTYDFTSGRSTYEYRASWIINPGCDMDNYDVYLSCVSENELDKPGVDCTKQRDPEGSNCDCLYRMPQEKLAFFYDGTRLSQNVLEDMDHHDILTEDFRYDHIKFKLKADRDIDNDENCFPQDHEDGSFYFPIVDKTATDVAACTVDYTTGIFRCVGGDLFAGGGISAYISSVSINPSSGNSIPLDESRPNRGFFRGDKLELNPNIWKGEGGDLCLGVTFSPSSSPNEQIFGVSAEGLHNYGPIVLEESMNLGQRRLEHPDDLPIVPYPTPEQGLGNKEDLTINLIVSAPEGTPSPISTAITPESPLLVQINNRQPTPISSYIIEDPNAPEHSRYKFVFSEASAGGEVKLWVKSIPALDPETNQLSRIIRVKGPTETVTETKTLKLTLYNLKGQNRTLSLLDNPTDDCDFNNMVKYRGVQQTKTYSIVAAVRSDEDVCVGDFKEPIPLSEPCKCFSSELNCPDNEYKYCYGACRSVKPCDQSIVENPALNQIPCICDSNTPKDQPADCGTEEQGRYCYQNQCSINRPYGEDRTVPLITSFRLGPELMHPTNPDLVNPPTVSGADIKFNGKIHFVLSAEDSMSGIKKLEIARSGRNIVFKQELNESVPSHEFQGDIELSENNFPHGPGIYYIYVYVYDSANQKKELGPVFKLIIAENEQSPDS